MRDEAERSEFESWARRHGYLTQRASNGCYEWVATDEAYKAWSAGRASLTVAQPAPAAPSSLPRHKFWGAGEPDCPQDLKAPNGELHTTRCKVCGDGWRKSVDVCFGTAPSESREEKAARFIRESGKTVHSSDCATSCAPAYEPGPCDCNEAQPADSAMTDAMLAVVRAAKAYHETADEKGLGHAHAQYASLRTALAAFDALEKP